ncbi:hypothetical protein ScalyP_jg1254 [Parmales sp. scaly parma]|nr:hypothetical protein ScalyP_jg1254 [Parmales sp. scaly parma]
MKQKIIFKNVHDELAQNLLIKMLSANPTDRIQSMKEVLSHPFFGSTNNDSQLTLINAKLQKEAEIRIQTLEEQLKAKGANVDELQQKLTSAKQTKRASIKAGAGGDPVDIASIIKAQLEEQTKLILRETQEIKNQLNRAEHFQKKILEKTNTILRVSETTQKKLDSTASSILRGLVESQISCPTSYVILPERLDERGECSSSQTDFVKKMSEFGEAEFDSVETVEKSMDSLKSFFKGDQFYFYLLNEYTGQPVTGGTIYPIVINKKSENLNKFLPMMKMGVKAVSVVNAGLGVAQMFGVPTPKFPPQLLSKASKTLTTMDKKSTIAEFELMQKSLNSCGGEEEGGKKNLRGKSLKELEGFFLLHDHDSDFGGLRKNVAPDGALMWCSESEGKLLFEGGAGGEGTGGEGVGDSERADMASKIALLEQKLEEKVEGGGGEGVGDSERADMASKIALLEQKLEEKGEGGGGEGVGDSERADMASKIALLEQMLAEKGEGTGGEGIGDSERADMASKIARLEQMLAEKGEGQKPDNLVVAQQTIERLTSELGRMSTTLSMSTDERDTFLLKSVLHKKSKFMKSWKPRTVTLDPKGTLTWDGGAGHKGFCQIAARSGAMELLESDTGGRKFCFSIMADGRSIAFSATSEEEMKSWVTAVNDFV